MTAPLQLGGRHDEAEPIGTPAQAAVHRHQPAVARLRQGDVLGVVGLRPAEILGYLPRGGGEVVRPLLGDPELAGQEPPQGKLGERVGDVATEDHLVEHGRHLAPEERRRDQPAVLVQTRAHLLTGPVERQLDHQAGVDDEHAQWESRERRTAAATSGIGSPVSVSPQPSGSATIVGSAESAGTTILARAASASSRSSTSRSNFSFAVTVQGYRPHPRVPAERSI